MEGKLLMVGDRIPTKRFYVVMTDTFMSGWGKAQGMKNKLVIGTDDYDHAEFLRQAALRRPEMKYVDIRGSKPSYGRNVLVSYKDADTISWKIGIHDYKQHTAIEESRRTMW